MTDARITINAFYGRNSHFLCFGEKFIEVFNGEKCKIRTNDVKATAFPVQRGATLERRFSFRRSRKATSNVTLHNDVLQHPDLKLIRSALKNFTTSSLDKVLVKGKGKNEIQGIGIENTFLNNPMFSSPEPT